MTNNSGRPLQRLGILGSPDGIYVRQLVSAAARRNQQTQIEQLAFSDIAVLLRDRRVRVTSQALDLDAVRARGQASDDPTWRSQSPPVVDLLALDGLIVRTMPLGSLEQIIFRMDALQAVERAGVPIVNPPRTLEIAIDKWLTLERLSAAGVPTPATVACQTRAAALEAFEMLGRDVVVKPLFGGEGRGIVRLNDIDMAWRVFGTLQQLGNVLYVQQFMPHFGYDIRVLKIGHRWLSVKRRAESGAWRTNVSQGSRAEPHELTGQQAELAMTAAEVTGGSLLGIDLLPCVSGEVVVLEVNAVPGWKGTAAALGIDIADLVIRHLEDLHAQRS